MGFRVRSVLLGAMMMVWVQCAPGLDPRGAWSQYGRQVWQTDNGLPQNTVHAIAQTLDGYIWMGTDDGLVRFDGVAFKVFTAETTPELRSSVVERLTIDRTGRLWVVTSAGVAVGQNGVFRGFGVADGLPDPKVWFVHQDQRGGTWIATAGGLCLVEKNRCEAVKATHGLSISQDDRLAEAPDGSLWLSEGAEAVHLAQSASGWSRVATLRTAHGAAIVTQVVGADGRLLVGTGDGLEKERLGILTPVPVIAHAGRLPVAALIRATDGSVWVGTAAGLVHGRGDRFAMFTSASAPVQRLFQDREGTILVGLEHGMGKVAGEHLEQLPSGDPLSSVLLLAALQDREGNLWLGTESDGVTVLHEQKFVTYTTAEGLSGKVVRSVLQDAAGTVWVGTDGAGLNRRTADSWVGVTIREGLSSNVVLSLASGADADLWVGTPTGLNRVRSVPGHGPSQSVKVFTTANGLADDFIRSLLVDAAGKVWIGTRHGLTRLDHGRMTTFTALDGLGSDFIGAMIQTRKGDLWIGTSGGLTREHEDRFTNFKVGDGSAKNAVTSLHEDPEGVLWLGSNGAGLSRMKDGIITPVLATNLPQDIAGVLEDAEHRLWIGSRNGIYRVATSELDRVIAKGSGAVALVAYDTSDGMRIRECSSGGHPAAIQTRDGTLWFATLRGVSVVDPERLHENRVAPLIAIETVLINDVRRDVARGTDGELVLEPGRQRVEFQYAGLSFVAPQKVRYRYRLEGFDRAWVEAGMHRAAFYTNLQPGRYVFHVAATNNDGVWSETDATMTLRIRPFFWQTFWFYGLLLVLAAGLSYLVYAWRVRRVETVFRGVLEERSRIAREIHDTLAQGIVSISLQLEVVTRLLGTSTEAARTQLDATRLLVRESLADARSSIWDLRSEGAEELPARVGKALKKLTGQAGIVGRLHVTGTYREIGQVVEDELVRIVQEAVTNAIRHAACSHVEVTLTYEMSAFRLAVVDDGHGFDAAAGGPTGHFGLRGMAERARKIGGRLEVHSQAGKGAQVELDLRLR